MILLSATPSPCTALHCTAQHCTALHCTALHCTALHCTALHCTALYCTAPTSASDNETKKNRKLNQVFIPGTPNQPPRKVCGELFVQKGEFIGATGLYAEDSTSKKQCTAMKFRISCNVNTVVEYSRSQKH
jgi:hypothetical protein